MLPMFLAAVDQTLLATATPAIAAELGGLSGTSWIAVAYLLSATVMAPLYGRLGDRLGRRNLLHVALVVFAAGTLLCEAAPSMSLLIGARAVQGLGGGGLMVLSQALIGELVEPRERPRYQGYFSLVFTASSVGGPVVGGLVIDHVSWRWLFLGSLPLSMLAYWRVSRLPVPDVAPTRGAPPDPLGVLLFAVTAVGALSWLSMVGHQLPMRSPAGCALAGFAALYGCLLWRQQRRHPHPFLPLDILRLPSMGWVSASVLFFASTLFALVFLLPIYQQIGHGASASASGMQMLPLTVGVVLGSWLNGHLTVRSGRTGHLPARGLGACAMALLVLALAPPLPWLTLLAAACCGLGLGFVMPNAQLWTQLAAGRRQLGAAAALISLTRSSRASFGTAAFAGLAFALLHLEPGASRAAMPVGLTQLAPAEVARAFRLVFLSLALFAGLGAWAATRIPVIELSASREGEAA
ncbi:MFS transporter [Schlegelella sp. S2-27]|uniref:MFS transporter n=1 Tax=Caldimonas mangrovi TaxID=2944811 RepID=A0ABT0YT73_9BURK|nr:MFS transporter [Caldimonas mangrovi]